MGGDVAGLQLTGFYDWGQVQANVDNDFPGAASPNRYDLKGYGVGLGWSGPRGFTLQATLARRIGDNPNPTAQGNDQDGTLRRNRVWLQASLPF